jgi:hypothetical protein
MLFSESSPSDPSILSTPPVKHILQGFKASMHTDDRLKAYTFEFLSTADDMSIDVIQQPGASEDSPRVMKISDRLLRPEYIHNARCGCAAFLANYPHALVFCACGAANLLRVVLEEIESMGTKEKHQLLDFQRELLLAMPKNIVISSMETSKGRSRTHLKWEVGMNGGALFRVFTYDEAHGDDYKIERLFHGADDTVPVITVSQRTDEHCLIFLMTMLRRIDTSRLAQESHNPPMSMDSEPLSSQPPSSVAIVNTLEPSSPRSSDQPIAEHLVESGSEALLLDFLSPGKRYVAVVRSELKFAFYGAPLVFHLPFTAPYNVRVSKSDGNLFNVSWDFEHRHRQFRLKVYSSGGEEARKSVEIVDRLDHVLALDKAALKVGVQAVSEHGVFSNESMADIEPTFLNCDSTSATAADANSPSLQAGSDSQLDDESESNPTDDDEQNDQDGYLVDEDWQYDDLEVEDEVLEDLYLPRRSLRSFEVCLWSLHAVLMRFVGRR